MSRSFFENWSQNELLRITFNPYIKQKAQKISEEIKKLIYKIDHTNIIKNP